MEYQLIPIPGDGNCLFRSVSHLIFGTQEQHRNIRLRVVNLVVNNWDVYKEFVIYDLSYSRIDYLFIILMITNS